MSRIITESDVEQAALDILEELARVYHPRDRNLYLNESWWGREMCGGV